MKILSQIPLKCKYQKKAPQYMLKVDKINVDINGKVTI